MGPGLKLDPPTTVALLPFVLILWVAGGAPVGAAALAGGIILAVVFPNQAKRLGNWLMSKVNLRFERSPTMFQWILIGITGALAGVALIAFVHAQTAIDKVGDYEGGIILLVLAFLTLNVTAWLNRRKPGAPPSRLKGRRPPYPRLVP